MRALILLVAVWLSPAGPGQAQETAAWAGAWLDAAQLEEQGAAQGTVALPDNWNHRVQGRGGVADYHLAFELPEAGADVGVFVPRLSRKADVLVNGIPVITVGRREPPVLPNWNEPQFFEIPALVLAEGANTITFRLTADARTRAGLSAVFVGPRDLARQRYERRVFWQTALPRFFELVVLLVAISMTGVWLMKRDESFIFWFALCAWMWSMRVHQLFTQELGLTPYQSDLLSAVSVHGSQLAEVIATIRLRRARMPRFEALMLLHFGAGTALLLASADAQATAAILRWMYLPVTVAAYTFNIWLAVHAWRKRKRPLLVFSILIMTAMSFGLRDFFVVAGVLAFDSIFLLRYGGPLMILALAGLLIERYVASLKRVERVNAELAERVAQKTRELEEEYNRSREREREITLLAERDRFARDIHDGIGSRLIAARASLLQGGAGHDELRRVLEECLADLRLIIDSFDPHADSLDILIGDFRYKSIGSLRAVFAEVEWDVEHLDACAWLGAKQNLTVLRALQEMLGNAMKHGDRDRLAVRTRCGAEGIEIAVENRVARGAAAPEASLQLSHRGLRGLERRARELGASFTFACDGGQALACLRLVRATSP
jgi:signal transduction histidine kinase